MSPSTDKYHVTGVGCASAVPLLRLAAQTLQGDASQKVLVVAAESMSSILMPARADDPRAKTVGSAIFGDGCAAALLSGGGSSGPGDPREPGPPDPQHARRRHARERCRRQPPRPRARPSRNRRRGARRPGRRIPALERAQGARRSTTGCCTRAARRILEHARDALGLRDEDIEVSWRALAEHGNVGTPSIFYVLHRTIKERKPGPGDAAWS